MKFTKFAAVIALIPVGVFTQQTNAQDMKIPTITLSNGIKMPQLGAGTFLAPCSSRNFSK